MDENKLIENDLEKVSGGYRCPDQDGAGLKFCTEAPDAPQSPELGALNYPVTGIAYTQTGGDPTIVPHGCMD